MDIATVKGATEPMISGISKVFILVDDQDRAKHFWTNRMGFEVLQDAPYGQERWLKVGSSDRGMVLVLSRTSAGPADRAAVPDTLPNWPVMFSCDDLPRTYAELSSRGVEFPQPPVQQPFGWWSLFKDTEGNRFALVPRGQ
jgi:predicted enzyme related to lactoylglutathione lyase